MNNWKQSLFAILLMFSTVLIDGFIASYWAESLNTDFGIMIPRTIILVMIIFSFHFDHTFMLASTAIFGLLMDSYYLGFFGPYLASLIMVYYIVLNIKKFLLPNIFSYTVVTILAITLVENFIYGIMSILGITSISYQMFIVSRLGATLLFNVLIMLVFGYFIHRLVLKVMDEA